MLQFLLGFFSAWFVLSVAAIVIEERNPKACAPFMKQHGILFGFIIAPAIIPMIPFVFLWYVWWSMIAFVKKKWRVRH